MLSYFTDGGKRMRPVDWVVHWWSHVTMRFIGYNPKVNIRGCVWMCVSYEIGGGVNAVQVKKKKKFTSPPHHPSTPTPLSPPPKKIKTPTQQVVGLENLPPMDETVVYVPNHTSFLDILTLSGFVPRPFKYISKIEILRCVGGVKGVV